MTDKPRFKLEDLSIDEGSLVDEGDNPEAHIKLFKLAPTSKAEAPVFAARTTAEILAERAFSDDFWKLRCAYVDSVQGILAMVEPSQMGGALDRTTSEFTSAVGELIASVGKLSSSFAAKLRGAMEQIKVAAAADPDSGAITKAVAALDGYAPDNMEDNVSQKNATPPALKTADEIIAALPDDQRAAIVAQLDAAKASEASAKADAEKARAEVSKAAADEAAVMSAALTKRLADTEATLAKMKDEALTAQFVAKAKEIGAGPTEDVATLLKSAFGRDPKEGELLERTLRALATQVRKGALFSVVGSDSRDGATDAEGRLDAEAKKIADAEKATYAVAYKRACERNPALAREAITKSRVVGE